MGEREDAGLVPAQVFVRLISLALAAVVAAALLASLDDIKRYLAIKDM